jgi:hypothetical protein
MVLLDQPKAVWPVHWRAGPAVGSAGPAPTGARRADRDGQRVDSRRRFAGTVSSARGRSGSTRRSDSDNEAEEEAHRSGRVRSAVPAPSRSGRRGTRGPASSSCAGSRRAGSPGAGRCDPCGRSSRGSRRRSDGPCRPRGCTPGSGRPCASTARVGRSADPAQSRRASRAAGGNGAGDEHRGGGVTEESPVAEEIANAGRRFGGSDAAVDRGRGHRDE